MLLKIVSIAITTLVHLPMSHTFGGSKFQDFGKLMHLAKRGGSGSWQVQFKGQGFAEVTYASRHEDVVLECEAGGSPSPTIHWLKNGERIQQGVSRDYLNDEASYEDKFNTENERMLRLGKVKSKLYLDCVSDKDEAVYTCVAETPYERITQSTELKMGNEMSQSKASCLTKKAFRGEPARIYLSTKVRVEFQGAPVQLFCRAEGYPAPSCNWRYSDQGAPIVDDDQYKILPNGDLLINEISFMKNMGDYFCSCENEAGIDEASTFLYPTTP